MTNIIEKKTGTKYRAEFNNSLNGYIVTFESGRYAYTQLEPETNRLHANYGELFLRRYPDYDDDLTPKEEAALKAFMQERNRSGEF